MRASLALTSFSVLVRRQISIFQPHQSEVTKKKRSSNGRPFAFVGFSFTLRSSARTPNINEIPLSRRSKCAIGNRWVKNWWALWHIIRTILSMICRSQLFGISRYSLLLLISDQFQAAQLCVCVCERRPFE